jgi:hypothetical protein
MGNAFLIRRIAIKASGVRERNGWLYGTAKPQSSVTTDQVRRMVDAILEVTAQLDPREPRDDIPGKAVERRRKRVQNSRPRQNAQRLERANRDIDEFLGWSQETEVLSELPVEAMRDFLGSRLRPTVPREFIERYGILRPEDLRAEVPDFLQDRILSIRNAGHFPFAMPLRAFQEEQRRLTSHLQLAQKIRDERWQKLEGAWGFGGAESLLAKELNERLSEARPVMNFRSGAAVPALHTLFVVEGLYAHVWNQLVAKTPVRLCSRCSVPFVPSRPRQEYCAKPCQQAAKQQRYRGRN